MKDVIFLKDYKRAVEVGAFLEERDISQPLVFTVTATIDGSAAGKDDHVDSVISYDLLIDAVEATLQAQRYNLLETMAERIAVRILSHPRILNVSVEIQKLGRIDGALGVCFARTRGDELPQIAREVKPAPALIVVGETETECPSLPADHAAVLVLKPDDIPKTMSEAQARAFFLRQDAKLWELGEAWGIAVVDSQTEADFFITKKQPFLRAYGKQIFDLYPKPNAYQWDDLLDWHKIHLGIINT